MSKKKIKPHYKELTFDELKKCTIVQCLHCGEVMVSTSVHHFVQCNCENQAFADGGKEYARVGAVNMACAHLISE